MPIELIRRIVRHLPHRLQEELQVFLGVAKGLLPVEQQPRIIRLGAMIFRQVGQVFQLVLGGLQPLFIGFGLSRFFLISSSSTMRPSSRSISNILPG